MSAGPGSVSNFVSFDETADQNVLQLTGVARRIF